MKLKKWYSVRCFEHFLRQRDFGHGMIVVATSYVVVEQISFSSYLNFLGYR